MKVLITGITGQDGSYLAELLLNRGHTVIGLVRRTSSNSTNRLSPILDQVRLFSGDITDFSSLQKIIRENRPEWIFNLAAQSEVGTSFHQPFTSIDVTECGVLNLLEIIRGECPNIRMYQASSSEMFGDSYSIDNDGNKYQDENTPFAPQSPYAIAKTAAHHYCQIYRNGYGLDIRTGILFNHTSPRRGPYFVEQKIATYIRGLRDFYSSQPALINTHGKNHYPKLQLGNISTFRDWGHAREYCEAMIRIMEYTKPDDFVISTGQTHSIEEFLAKGFAHIGIDNFSPFIERSSDFIRPCEVPFLKGRSEKARILLKWFPTITFNDIVEEMIYV